MTPGQFDHLNRRIATLESLASLGVVAALARCLWWLWTTLQ